MEFYDRLCRLIKDKGLSQRKVEIDLGFSNGAMSKWKNHTPNMDKVQRLAEYFNVSAEYLMTGEEKGEKYYINDETAQIAQQIFENKELRLLFDTAKDSSNEDIETVHNMLLALKRKEQHLD